MPASVTRTSPRRFTAVAAGILALALIAAVYLHNLGGAPVYLDGDEAHFGIHAYSIAQSGRNLDGSAMPLFVNLWDPLGDPKAHEQNEERRKVWYQPILFYLIALMLKVAPLTEASIRTPTAVIAGILNPLLMYAAAFRLFKNRWYAAAAALLLVLSPAHLVLGREALDYMCPLPFVLGWLWCLVAFGEQDNAWLPLAGGLMLGAGFYSFIGAWVFMPVCLVLTWIFYFRMEHGFGRASAAAGLGFVIPLLALIPWVWLHPTMLAETLGRYPASGAAESSTAPAGLLNLNALQHRLSVYWDYFDPSFLFLTGGVGLTASTGRAGVFLLPVAVLLPPGIYELLRRAKSTGIAIVLLGGLAMAPIPATLVGERYVAQRDLFVLPFGALVATFGLAVLLRQRRRAVQLFAAFVIATIPLQFAYVYRDYLGHYKLRSGFWYDPAAFRDAAEYALATASSDDVPVVYLSRLLDDGGPKWRFYVTKHHREDLLERTEYVDGDGRDLENAPPGSLMIVYANPRPDALLRSGQWSIAKTSADVDGRAASLVLRKARE